MSVVDQGCLEITQQVKASPTTSFDVGQPFTRLIAVHYGVGGIIRQLVVVLTGQNASFKTNQFQVGDCVCWTAYA